MKKIVYVDLDGVIVNIQKEIDSLPDFIKKAVGSDIDRIDEIFKDPEPIDGAIEGFKRLFEEYDPYILSTAPWNSPKAWEYKRLWVERHLGVYSYKRLILSHHKNLLCGDYLIDDRTKNGAGEFGGELILFGQKPFKTWTDVLKYLNV